MKFIFSLVMCMLFAFTSVEARNFDAKPKPPTDVGYAIQIDFEVNELDLEVNDMIFESKKINLEAQALNYDLFKFEQSFTILSQNLVESDFNAPIIEIYKSPGNLVQNYKSIKNYDYNVEFLTPKSFYSC
jgi:hypothetical protein